VDSAALALTQSAIRFGIWCESGEPDDRKTMGQEGVFAMKRLALLCLLVSAALSVCIVLVGVQNNAMAEFCVDPDTVDCAIDLLSSRIQV
jgi:hypothetical protein